LNWREGRWEDSENKIVNNLAMNNGAGIVLRFANRNKIHANIVTGNTFHGNQSQRNAERHQRERRTG